MNKRCYSCGETKDASGFNKARRRKDGLQTECRECNKKRHQERYKDNPKVYYERNKRQREEKTEWVCQYLEQNPCVDCGEDDIVVLDFDHLHNKIMDISHMVGDRRSMEKIKSEIAKCEVRCANCHRRITAERSQSYKWRKSSSPRATPGK